MVSMVPGMYCIIQKHYKKIRGGKRGCGILESFFIPGFSLSLNMYAVIGAMYAIV
jgi:hypothetical protein